MGKFLDAFRAKNGSITKEQLEFLEKVELAMSDYVKDETGELENRQSQAIKDAIDKVVGNMPADEAGNLTTVIEQLRKQAEQISKIESQSTRKMNNMEKFQLRRMLDMKKDEIKAAMNQSGEGCKIEFSARAAQLMTTTNVVTGASTTTAQPLEWDNEIAYIKYPRNFVLEIIRSRQVEKVPKNIVKREQKTEEGSAAITAEGAVKPLVSYTFEDTIYPSVKIAGHIEWAEEFELYFDNLFNAIVDLFETNVLRTWQNSLLDKIITNAPVYVSTPLDNTIPFPNIYTAIGAGILSIQTMMFEPDVIWMNPADLWAMNLTQDANGATVVPPIMVGSNQIAGLRVLTSTKIASGKILIGQSDTWRELHSGYITRIGLINDQLIRNEKTIVGEVYSLMYQANADKGSWIYLDIPTVIAALQKPAVTP